MALDPFAPDEGPTAGIPQLPDAVKNVRPPPIPKDDEHEVEREPVVCRWCKGKREITVNFKTKPCDCVKGDGTVGPFAGTDDIGRDWKVKHEYRGLL